MLPKTWRIHCKELYRSSGSYYIHARLTMIRWRYVDGVRTYDDTEHTFDIDCTPAGSVYSASQNNSSDKWRGADVVVEGRGEALFNTIQFRLWLEVSTDGGTTFARMPIPLLYTPRFTSASFTEVGRFAIGGDPCLG